MFIYLDWQQSRPNLASDSVLRELTLKYHQGSHLEGIWVTSADACVQPTRLPQQSLEDLKFHVPAHMISFMLNGQVMARSECEHQVAFKEQRNVPAKGVRSRTGM